MSSAAPAAARAARPATPPWPWLDHRGNVCPLRVPGLILLSAPGAWLALQWAAGWLGPEPVKAVLHGTGLWAVRFLLLSLAVSPLRVLSNWSQLVYLRRQIGVGAFCYALAHLLLYALNENLDLVKVALEIVRRFYLTIGFVALIGLGALAFTSTNAAVKRMGKNWKRLHRLTYPIGALALFHFFLQSKADVSEPVLVSGLFLWLMIWRGLPERAKAHPWVPFALAPAAALGAAGIEYAWYALATKIPADLVLAANLDPELAPRPAAWVLLGTLALATTATLWRHAYRR
jgi:methionine sulfoxide reductase heme-binding subunit